MRQSSQYWMYIRKFVAPIYKLLAIFDDTTSMKNLLLLLSLLFFTSSFIDNDVKRFGFYSNEKSTDGEHSLGYTIQLWKYDNNIIGKIEFNEGLIGDQVGGFIENVKYNSKTGNLIFQSQLDTEKITFIGKVYKAKIIGKVIWKTKTDKNQVLEKCCNDAEINRDFPTIKDWKSMWQKFE